MNNEDAARITEIPDAQRNGPHLSGSRVYSSTDKAVSFDPLDVIGNDVKEMIHMGDGNDAEEIARNEFARVPGVDGHLASCSSDPAEVWRDPELEAEAWRRTVAAAVKACPCCEGSTDFNWFTDACDECAGEIVNGSWDEGHPHQLSPAQLASIREGRDNGSH